MLHLISGQGMTGSPTISSPNSTWRSRAPKASKRLARTIPSSATGESYRHSKTGWRLGRDKRSKSRGCWTCKWSKLKTRKKFRKWRMWRWLRRCLNKRGSGKNRNSKKPASGGRRLWNTSKNCSGWLSSDIRFSLTLSPNEINSKLVHSIQHL